MADFSSSNKDCSLSECVNLTGVIFDFTHDDMQTAYANGVKVDTFYYDNEPSY